MCEQNKSVSYYEEAKAEENRDGTHKKNTEAKATIPLSSSSSSPLILSLDLHCIGCAKKIKKSLLKITGVVGVKTDMVKKQMTVKGFMVEAHEVCNKIMEKTKTRVDVVNSPAHVPAANSRLISTTSSSILELNVNMHCEACAQQLTRYILKIKGVSKVETEVSSGKVRVIGNMDLLDGEKLVEYLYRRTRKQAKILHPHPQPQPQPQPHMEKQTKPQHKKDDKSPPQKEEQEQEDKKEDEDTGNDNINQQQERMSMMVYNYYSYQYQYQHPLYRIPPPQLFSDDNPNACSIC